MFCSNTVVLGLLHDTCTVQRDKLDVQITLKSSLWQTLQGKKQDNVT